MPELKPAWESLEKLQAFLTFATQEAAAAASAPGAKDYIPTQDGKNWFDPNADKPGPDPEMPGLVRVIFYVGEIPFVLYSNVFKGRQDANQDGLLDKVAMPVPEAMKVNIKPPGSNIPGTGTELAVPLKRELLPTEKIRRQSPLGGFMLRHLDVPLATEAAAQTVESIAADLQEVKVGLSEIQLKLGKIMAEFRIT